jgi:regulator of sigma E protease
VSWVYTFLGFIGLIVLHEAGHFAAAKAVGMRVDRFSLFFGPMLVKFRRGETEYGIGPIPLGGYVKIFGMNPYELEPGGGGGTMRTELGLRPRASEDGEGEREAEPPAAPPIPPEEAARAFYRQPVWKRVFVIGAGPAVNILLAFVILWGVYLTSAQVPVKGAGAAVQVVGLQGGSPAASALQPGDRVLALDGRPVRSPQALAAAIQAHPCAGHATVNGCSAATPVQFTVVRGDRDVSLAIRPRYDAAAHVMRVGVTSEPTLTTAGTGQAAHFAVDDIWNVSSQTVSHLAKILFSAKARSNVHSVVGVSDVASQAFSHNTAEALWWLAIISLSLGIINLFPFLPLDGGHIFWALAEKVRGRPIPFSVLERASVVGLALVLMLFAVGITNDINTFSNGGFHVR